MDSPQKFKIEHPPLLWRNALWRSVDSKGVARRLLKILGVWIVALSSPVLTWGHHIPIFPVKITITARPDVLRVLIDTHSQFWKEGVINSGLRKVPARDLPQAWVKRIKTYVLAHFELFIDGKPLKGSFTNIRYVEEPFHVAQARFLFELEYPYDRRGKILSGRVDFFKRFWKESVMAGHVEGDVEEYKSILSFSGAQKIQKTVPVSIGRFEVPVSDILLTQREYVVQNFLAALRDPFQTVPFSLFIFLTLLLRPRRAHPATGAALFFLSGFILYLLPFFRAGSYPLVLSWCLILLMSGVNTWKESKAFWMGTILLSGLGWGSVWSNLSGLQAYPQEYVFCIRGAYFLGTLLGGLLFGFLVLGSLKIYQNKLTKRSEQAADRIFLSHRRFVSVSLMAFSFFQLIRTAFNH